MDVKDGLEGSDKQEGEVGCELASLVSRLRYGYERVSVVDTAAGGAWGGVDRGREDG